eukprot:5201905-Pleurochrysis_carterae.AAC.4
METNKVGTEQGTREGSSIGAWQPQGAACSSCGRAAPASAAATMHPGGRPHPDPTHMLEQAAKYTQSCCVGGVCKRALDAIHGLKSLVSGQKKHSRSGDEDHSKPKDRSHPLAASLGLHSHGKANRARDSVPRAQDRHNAISAHRRKDDVICIHEGGVHARLVLAK